MGDYAQSDFDTLYRDNYNNLLRLAYRSTKDYHESEDLVDEAFVIYLQKSGTVHISNPRAYLIKIMSNLICNYLRLKMHDNVPLSDALENELGVDGLKRSLADALPKELQLWEREILLSVTLLSTIVTTSCFVFGLTGSIILIFSAIFIKA